jgi:hypothetical protein
VFTLPEELSALMLGNRRATYRLLFHAAWHALREVMREEQGCEPAALMVLHTWSQRLEHHPHIHALVPGGGPSFDGRSWVRSRHPDQPWRRTPYLVDNRLLSARFREKFVAGLTRLHRTGKLKLAGEWSHLKEPAAFTAWLKTFGDRAWVVFIEPPPENSRPEQVLKYLARYLTGGPISDRRLIEHADGEVTFWVRGKDKSKGNRPERYTLPGIEFTRRWALHILPKGFVKSRCFGGYSGRKREAYLRCCRDLLRLEQPASEPADMPGEEPAEERQSSLACPECQATMECLVDVARPGWNEVLSGWDRPRWYDPFGRARARSSRRGYREPPDR